MTALALLAACAPVEDLGREYTEPVPILDASGAVDVAGWARAPLFAFERDRVAASRAGQVKEWDFYAVYGPDFAVNVTLAEISVNGTPLVLGGFQVHDYAEGVFGPSLFGVDGDALDFAPEQGGSYDVSLVGGRLRYGQDGGARTIEFTSGDDHGALRIEARATESMALVTPFSADEFFYEDKVLGLDASGAIDLGDRHWDVPEGSLAVLDFVRAVTPGQVTWDWAHAVGAVDGQRVGVNLGSVFGDEAHGTPDALFVDGVLHKVGRVAWTYDTDDVTAPWRFVSEEGDRVDLRLVSDHGYSEVTDVDLGAYRARLWKLYGRLEGTVVLDDGTALEVDLVGAAEHLETTW